MARLELLGLDSTNDPVVDGRWELGDTEYYIRLAWNEREAAYIVEVWTADLTPVQRGTPAQTGVNIFDNITVEGRPPGRLYIEDTTGAADEIGFAGFGRGKRLVYDDDGVST